VAALEEKAGRVEELEAQVVALTVEKEQVHPASRQPKSETRTLPKPEIRNPNFSKTRNPKPEIRN